MNIALPPRPAPPPVWNARLGLFLLGFAAICLVLVYTQNVEWWIVKWTLRNRFPTVSWITTHELAAWLQDEQRVPPQLLDVRTPQEWDVSRLPAARRIDPGSDPVVALAGVATDTPIVTYCAVGYRSGQMADRLQKAGFTRVYNLEGSIFAWSNEERPLVRDEVPVRQVHSYDQFWAKLLSPEARAPLGH